MTDTGTAPAVTDGETPVNPLVAGLRETADFLERFPELNVWTTAELRQHFTDGEQFTRHAEMLGADLDLQGSYAHARLRFGPVFLDIQAEAAAIRRAENLAAFRAAYGALTHAIGLDDTRDMARRYALTGEQTIAVLDEAFGGSGAQEAMTR